MRIIDQYHDILDCSANVLQHIEECGRIAYKSEDKITEDSAGLFVSSIVKRDHLAVIEHASMTVKFITDRGVSHELVRHRMASYTQESTRYCNYSKDKFGGELTFVRPVEMSEPNRLVVWHNAMVEAEKYYFMLLSNGESPQQARSVLPNSLKTEIVVTANMREWRHIFKLRAIDPAAHPQMRALMLPLYRDCKRYWPELFTLVNE